MLSVLVAVGFITSWVNIDTDYSKDSPSKVALIQLGYFSIQKPNLKYGFALDTFQVIQSTIQNNEFLSELLEKHQVNYLDVEEIAKNAKDIFPVTKLRAKKDYTILTKDSTQAADYFIYEPDVYSYVIYQLKPPFKVEKIERSIKTTIRTASGSVESSLWNTMVDNGLSFELTSKMEDALAWSIDFYHIQKGRSIQSDL